MRNFFRSKEEVSKTETPYKTYKPVTADLSDLKSFLEAYLQEKEKKGYRVFIVEDELRLETNITHDSKKNKKSFTSYQITEDKDFFDIKSQKVIETNGETETTFIDLYDKPDKIIDTILEGANQNMDDGFYAEHLNLKIEFITPLIPSDSNFLLAQLTDKEICLACLGITNLTSDSFEVKKQANYYLVLTSHRNMIFGTTPSHKSMVDISSQTLELKEKRGKDQITSKDFTFDTEYFNDKLFVKIHPLLNQTPEKRVEGYADILFHDYNRKETHLLFLERLYKYQTHEKDVLRRTVKSQLLKQFVKRECAKELVTNNTFMDLVYVERKMGHTLSQALKDWSIPALGQYRLIELLIESHDNHKLKNIGSFYTSVITEIIDSKKPPKNLMEYRIKHLAYLKDTKQYKNAIPFYEYVLENLEDDSILELISDTKTNVLDGEDCHPLRIQLLEELSEIKTTLNLSNESELLELAQLQPLVLDRLTQLVTTGVASEKANKVLELFMKGAFNNANFSSDEKVSSKSYDKEELFDIVAPACFKEAKGFMDSFTNLIAQVTPPEYKEVTTYSEKLSPNNYCKAYEIFEELKEQLKLDELECYIGNGKYSKGIIGVEGTPNFLIVGKEHLETGLPHSYTMNELKFHSALESTHILFEHTRITSKDVWRGAKNKGIDLAGVLLIALPMVGSIGNYAGRFIDTAKYTKLFTGVEKATNVIDKGQTAIEYGDKITEKFTKNSKESELLATSRLMEISADRVGLLVNNDLKSGISVLLKNNNDFEKSIQEINENGLLPYLSQQNKKGEYIHQELIIRIKTLCSFYIR